MTVRPEIDRANFGVDSDIRRCGPAQNATLHQHDDFARKPENNVHVVLDDQDGDIGRQPHQHVMNVMCFGGRHARRGFIQQQNAWLECKRNRDLQQPLLPVGKLAHDPIADMADAHLGQPRLRFLKARTPLRSIAHHAPCELFPLRNGDRHVVTHAKLGEQRVDLVRARKPLMDALFGRHRFDGSRHPAKSSLHRDARNPVSRLTNVVLPAPLGPIRPTRAPGTRSTSIDWATTSAPKLLHSPRTERASGALIGHPYGGAGAEIVAGRLAPDPTSPPSRNRTVAININADHEFPEVRADTRGFVLHQIIDRGPDERAI